MNRVLVVDDERSTRESLKMILKDSCEVLTTESALEALEALERDEPEVIILDVIMPDMGGLEALRRIREINPDIPVIMLTATQAVKTAVTAMKEGAFDYINKPFEVEEIRIIVEKALRNYALTHEVKLLRRELQNRYGFSNILGRSKTMREIYRTIQLVSEKRATVLIAGESGTGKELIARAIHFNSPRREKPFVAVNCAAIPERLIESELFGHEKGAFTDAVSNKAGQFELAGGGTLFLDEIAELSMATQAKILRALQERLIAATNKDLEKLIEEGSFRSDLYFRVNVVPIQVPPLRKRAEDIPLLFNHFLAKFTEEEGTGGKKISPEALDTMMQYHWPGNVRELENVVERMVALCPGEKITMDDLPLNIRKNIKLNAFKHAVLGGSMSLEKAEDQFIKDIILEALEKSDHVQTRAARMLGVTRRVLKYRMDRLGITPGGDEED